MAESLMTFNTKILAGALSLVLVAGMTSPAFAGAIQFDMDPVLVEVDLGIGEYTIVEKTFLGEQLVVEPFDATDCENKGIGIEAGIVPDTNSALVDETITNENAPIGATCSVFWPVSSIFLGTAIFEQTIIVTVPPQVAGELLPLDSTALLIGGLSSMSVFMIPAVAGIAGAAVYLVKYRDNKE
jgi:hypothetical protein